MQSLNYQKRFYRNWVKQKGLYSLGIIVKETDLVILTDKPVDREFALKRIQLYRRDIESYINKDSRFLTELKPIEVELNARPIIKAMSRAAKKANVGPMAAVAGAIAQFLGQDLLKNGYREVIIENGGDIFLATHKERSVAVYAGESRLWKDLKLVIKPKDSPLGICTSSGTIGHSLSFGCADSVVILAQDTTLADAVATAAANRINSSADLEKAVNFARSVKGICGASAILKNNLVSWGKIEILK
ncbi:UPF0280 family protein [bacterium]|nr:MAG: UPF0280 family protein [bacterium]